MTNRFEWHTFTSTAGRLKRANPWDDNIEGSVPLLSFIPEVDEDEAEESWDFTPGLRDGDDSVEFQGLRDSCFNALCEETERKNITNV